MLNQGRTYGANTEIRIYEVDIPCIGFIIFFNGPGDVIRDKIII